MKETVITWTIANWITVFLMFIGASLVFGVALKLITKMRAPASEG
jgi:hypothetical protein